MVTTLKIIVDLLQNLLIIKIEDVLSSTGFRGVADQKQEKRSLKQDSEINLWAII